MPLRWNRGLYNGRFDEDMEYIPSNREKRRAPKMGKFWCYCDLAVVGEWQKCPNCGRRNGISRMKK